MIEIYEDDNVKKVGLKISGGADSAIVGYMLCKYVKEQRPDITIIPITTISHINPYQEIYAKKVIDFYKSQFGDIFGKHWVNATKDNEDYIEVQKTLLIEVYEKENLDCHYNGITSNPPSQVMETFDAGLGPVDDRNGKTFSVVENTARRHLINIDKRGVAEIYKKLGLMDTLFPLTRSCEAYEGEARYNIDRHCEECWWCKERFYGFGRYT